MTYSVTYGKTVNIGNYESERYALTMEFSNDTTIVSAFAQVKKAVELIIVQGEERNV